MRRLLYVCCSIFFQALQYQEDFFQRKFEHDKVSDSEEVYDKKNVQKMENDLRKALLLYKREHSQKVEVIEKLGLSIEDCQRMKTKLELAEGHIDKYKHVVDEAEKNLMQTQHQLYDCQERIRTMEEASSQV